MNQKLLGSTGEMVSEFCFGAMTLGTKLNKEESYQLLDHFVSLGGNFIDTANCYSWWFGTGEFIGDESESMLGDWMKDRNNRDQLLIATKVGARLKDPYHIRNANGEVEYDRVRGEYQGLSADVIRKDVEESLRRLKTDHIDLYYTHVYDEETPIEETMTVLHELVKEGKIRYIGASNLTTEQLAKANEVAAKNSLTPYTVLQQEYSFIHPNKGVDTGIVNHANDEMFDYVQRENMGFCAYSPLIKGIYANREKREQYYDWSKFNSELNVIKLDLVEKLASKLNITGNQLVLCWMLQNQQKPIFPILGFSSTKQYYENIQVCDIKLPQEVIDLLNQNN